MRILLDVKALLALGIKEHQFNPRVEKWIASLAAQGVPKIATCSITELGFVRIASQIAAYGFTVDEVRNELLQLKRSKNYDFQFAQDRNDISKLPTWVRLSKQTTDGHLVRLAKSNGAVLATLDNHIPIRSSYRFDRPRRMGSCLSGRWRTMQVQRAAGADGVGEDLMMIMLKWTLALFLLVFSALAVYGQTENEVLESIAKSHIEANVPDRQHFEEYLRRDLAAYFKKQSGKDVTVEYELLRDGPTQTGIAFPKFYAWVTIREKETVIDQGAVRLAAIQKERFDVTHFLPRSEALQTHDAASKIFPADVVKKIDAKLGKIKKSEA